MKMNRSGQEKTYEGGKAVALNPEQLLERSVMSCLLWEKAFYEDGEEIVDRIRDIIPACTPYFVANLAVKARKEMYLRHTPLLIANYMAGLDDFKHYVPHVLEEICDRPDQLTEFLAIYWMNGKVPIAACIKRGLAAAFKHFNEYQLAKWNRDEPIKLRDVMFLTHPKPENSEQAALWKKLANNDLEAPDTWEVALSGGADKKETFERLLREKKLGGMATIMNLRNMIESGVEVELIRQRMQAGLGRVLPFRFITAARYVPEIEDILEIGMQKSIENIEPMPGKTILLVDVSGSMDWALSKNGMTTKMDAANGLAILLRGLCANIKIYSFSKKCIRIPNRSGFALSDAIVNSQKHISTCAGEAIKSIYNEKDEKADRFIMITDEQFQDNIDASQVSALANNVYTINVASESRGVTYNRPWIHIDGWSEKVVDFIKASEE